MGQEREMQTAGNTASILESARGATEMEETQPHHTDRKAGSAPEQCPSCKQNIDHKLKSCTDSVLNDYYSVFRVIFILCNEPSHCCRRYAADNLWHVSINQTDVFKASSFTAVTLPQGSIPFFHITPWLCL